MFTRHAQVVEEEEKKDVFAPVADLMVGVVFIFIILMIALVLNLQREDTVPVSQHRELQARLSALTTENSDLNERLAAAAALLAAERVRAAAAEAKLAEATDVNRRLSEFARFVRDSNIMRLMSQLASADETRTHLLEEMRKRLLASKIDVTVNPAVGTLMLPARRLFDVGRADPTAEGRKTIVQLGAVMSDVLPCYAVGAQAGAAACGPGTEASRLNAVYIEGHTDVSPFASPGGRFTDNWDLSAARAIEAFKLVGVQFEGLRALRNKDGDALLGVSGYGDTRPAGRENGDRKVAEIADKDRRIEVRVIMATNQELVGSVLTELLGRLQRIDDLVER